MRMRIWFLRRHLWIPAVLLITSILAVGAKNIADELSTRPLRQRETERKLGEWSRQMVSNLDSNQREQWQLLAEEDPHALIKACLIETNVSTSRRYE